MHFSIGFVTYGRPKKPIVSICGGVLDVWNVDALWPRDDGMFCRDEHGCVQPGSICAPRGDDVLLIVSVYDTDGDQFDISGATEIVFAVADELGGEVRFVKRLTLGQIAISTNLYQFSVTITDSDTSALVKQHNYYEARIETSDGLKKTVSAGLFFSQETMIKDI